MILGGFNSSRQEGNWRGTTWQLFQLPQCCPYFAQYYNYDDGNLFSPKFPPSSIHKPKNKKFFNPIKKNVAALLSFVSS